MKTYKADAGGLGPITTLRLSHPAGACADYKPGGKQTIQISGSQGLFEFKAPATDTLA